MAARGGGDTTNHGGTESKSKPEDNHHHIVLPDIISSVNSAISTTYSFLCNTDLLLLPSHALTLESTLSDTSRSLSKLVSLLHTKPVIPPSIPPSTITTTTSITNCWFHRFLLSASADYDPRWLDCFRMSRPTFSLLLCTLSSGLHSFFPSIPPNYALGAALYRLGHAASYAAVGRRFGLSAPDACRAFYAVCKLICNHLGHLFEFRSDTEKIVLGFGWISLPNCCGVLGVEPFPVEGEFLGNNGYLIVQALVDSEGRFLDVSAGWPSTMKPDTVLRQTKLFTSVEESKDLLNGASFELIDGNLVPQYILGASCYPLFPWLITPYHKMDDKYDLSSLEMSFNNVHKRAMGLLRTAFMRVRAQWRLLRRPWKEECVELFPFIIITGCLLHNFLIKHGEIMLDGDIVSLKEQEVAVYDGVVDESARRIRDVLALHLSRVSERR